MSRLLTSVREAEERLAGLARALQSAWDEEVAEASAARESARRSLVKATAMLEAAVALGRRELAARVEEVVNQLRAAETEASRRLDELVATERSFQHRLEGVDASRRLGDGSSGEAARNEAEVAESVDVAPDETTGPVAEPEAEAQTETVISVKTDLAKKPEAEDQSGVDDRTTIEPEPETAGAEPASSELEVEVEVDAPVDAQAEREPTTDADGEPEPVVGEEGNQAESEEETSESAPPPAPAEKSPAESLSRRVAELERVVARLPDSIVEPALEELVALSRLLARGPGVVRARQAQELLERLRKVAASRGKETTFGLSDDEFADWASLAADARNRRQKVVESFKARRAARR